MSPRARSAQVGSRRPSSERMRSRQAHLRRSVNRREELARQPDRGRRTILRHRKDRTPERAPFMEERAVRFAAWVFVFARVLAACTPAAEESPGGGGGSPGGEGTVEGSIRVALGDIEGVDTL